MPGATTVLRQERLKKTSARPSPLGLFTITEEDEQQKNWNPKRPRGTRGSAASPALWGSATDRCGSAA